MDPNAKQLDPKLKETYDRVMGTPTTGSVSDTSTPSTPGVVTNDQTTVPPVANPTIPTAPTNTPVMPTPSPVSDTPIVTSTPPTDTPSDPSASTPIPSVPDISTPEPASAFDQQTPAVDTTSSAPDMPSAPTMPTLDTTPTVPETPAPMSEPQAPTSPISDNSMQSTVSLSQPAAVAAKKKSGVPLILWIIGGVVVLLAYTLFWVKFFNIPVPIINP